MIISLSFSRNRSLHIVSDHRLVSCLVPHSSDVGVFAHQFISELDHFVSLLLNVIGIALMRYLHNCGRSGRLQHSFLELDLMEEQLVSIAWT
jgi:hypothetical protein